MSAPPQRQPSGVVEVALGIVVERLYEGERDRHRILVTRRRSDTVLPGLWEFPGGKIEPGESDAEAVRRELMEEVGLSVRPISALAVVEHDYPHGRVRLHPWVCQRLEGEPRNLHVADHRWIEPEDLESLELPPATRPVIAELLRHLLVGSPTPRLTANGGQPAPTTGPTSGPAAERDVGPIPLLAARELVRRFGPTTALDGVTIEFQPGQVHAVVGENGAGKSTLMRILAGLDRPDAGALEWEGRPMRLDGPRSAERLGVVMVHQEFNLIDSLGVADNILLGREPIRLGLVDRRAMRDRALRCLDRLDAGAAGVRPEALVAGLSVAQKQLVEIAKALSHRARLMILDEPTAVLGGDDTRRLLSLIRSLADEGTAVVYISHHLREVLAVADRITVLRDGRVAARTTPALLCRDVGDATPEHRESQAQARLASLMVGRQMGQHFPPRRPCGHQVRLRVHGCMADPARSLEVRAGEVLGIAGLVGAGRTELAEAMVGLAEPPSGRPLRVEIDGRGVARRSVTDALDAGIVYLSEDRRGRGLVMGMSVRDNITLPSLRRWGRCLTDPRRETLEARTLIDRLGVRPASPHHPVDRLSGGNQQKVALARWLLAQPKALILDEPTRGIDIAAKQEVYRLILELAGRGLACVVISSELLELLGMCHRIAVMRRGEIVRVQEAERASEESLMRSATGSLVEEPWGPPAGG